MAKIADLIVSLSADIASFRSGMEEANAHLAEMRAQTAASNEALNAMARDSAKWGSDLGKVVQGVTDKFRDLASLFGIGFGIREIVATIEESQNAIAKLDAVLTSTGGAAGFSEKELVNYADSLEKTTTFSHTAIESAEALALTFTNIAHQNVLPLIAESLNIAALRGEDLSSVVLELGRVLNDPIKEMGMLGREGISLSATQQELIKKLAATGQAAEAQTIILDDIKTSYGGVAAALRDTVGGALDALGHNIKDLVEDLGTSGLDGALGRVINDAATFTANLDNAAKESKLTNLVDQYNQLTSAIDNAKAAQASGGNEYAFTGPFYLPQKVDQSKYIQDLIAQRDAVKSKIGPAFDIPAAAKAPAQMAPMTAAPEAQKKLEEFQQQYKELLDSYGVDLDYQQRLKDAYQQGSLAVQQLTAQHAGEVAVEKLLADAQKAGAQVTAAQVSATFKQAASAEQATLAADNQKTATAALVSQQTQYQQKLEQVLAASDGLSKKNNELADDMAILDQQVAAGAMSLTEYATRAKALQANIGGADQASKRAADQVSSAVARGASSFLEAGSAALTGRNGLQGFAEAARGLAADLIKVVEQATILGPLTKALNAEMNSMSASGGLGAFLAGILGFGIGGSAASSDAATNDAYSALQDSGALDPLLGIFGFQQGGSFNVGGTGSPDSKLVAFMATPGEHVQVGDSGSKGGIGNVIINNNHSSAQVTQSQQKNSNGGTDIVVQIEDAMAARYRRGQGNMRRAIEQSHSLNQTPIQR